MAKRKKPKTMDRHPSLRQILSGEQVSITGEANHIIGLAQMNDSHVVKLGNLIFFSTETGDAWMLDTEDALALCLAKDGEIQPFKINETEDNFRIEWKANYPIEGDAFIPLDRSGRMRTIFGYPVKAILQVARMS